MPDTYKFRIPINFDIEVPGGKDNPDWRPKLLENVKMVLHTLLRAESNQVLFDYPVEINEKTMRMRASVGHLATHQIPARFKIIKVEGWYHIASEIHSRSKKKLPLAPGQTSRLIDVPYPVGRYAYMIMQWIAKYQYVTSRQTEMLEFWAEKYSTEAKVPPPPDFAKIASQKAVLKKVAKGWNALKDADTLLCQ